MTRAHGGTTELGALMRHWRDLRRKSQLDLSLESGISQRHISFIESGRSAPSRHKLAEIAEALDIPLRERNALLLAAGYAPTYADGGWDGPAMRPVMRALRRMLRQHEPFPAVVMDRYWTVLYANAAAPAFFKCFVDLDAWPKPRNLLRLMFDPAGLRPYIVDWDATANSLLARLRREAVGRVIDETTEKLLADLLAYPGVDEPSSLPELPVDSPVIPVGFIKNGAALRYFSMVATVGTPQTIAAQELRLECMVPADAATERRHLALMSGIRAERDAERH